MERSLQSRLAATAILGLLDAGLHVPVSGVSHKFSRQPICGSDMGKPDKQIQRRNAPCSCGSGRKAKKCCVYVTQQSPPPSSGESK